MPRLRSLVFIALIVAAVAALPRPSVAVELMQSGFRAPVGLTVDAEGNVYVSNWSAGSVERIAPDGVRSSFAEGLDAPSGLAVGPDGRLFVATYSGDSIVRYDGNGSRQVIASGLSTPAGITFGNDGRLLVTNRAAGEVLSMDPETGTYDVLADGFSLPVGVVDLPDGSLVVSQFGGRVTLVTRAGERRELGGDFGRPGVGIVEDGDDAVFVVDYGDRSLRRVTLDGRSAIVTREIQGSPVALARDRDGALLLGTWGPGNLYRIPTEAR